MRDMVVLISLDGSACRSMARTLRAEHIYCKILPSQSSAQDVIGEDARGILLAGASTGEKADIPHLDALLGCGLPILGMGDAALTLCEAMGGSLGEKARESAVVQVRFDPDEPLMYRVESGERFFPALRCMNFEVDSVRPLARTDAGLLGFGAANTDVYGLAFLPEQNDPDGIQLLLNFCQNVCGCTPWWSHQSFQENAQAEILQAAGEDEAICALSGGVDSGVCALLGHMALGHRLHCLFVDTGLLRKDEGDQVVSVYRDQMGLNLTRVDAAEEFLAALQGAVTLAEKEHAVYACLQQILARELKARPRVKLMLRGTNYADVLESIPAENAPESVRILEPVSELFKEEIRRVGEDRGLPQSIINRQPFPGAGLACRINGEVTKERLTVLQEADAIFRTELESDRQCKRLYQYYAMLTPASFSEGYAIILRAVQIVEGNIRIAARPPHDLLERVAQRIRAELPQVTSVSYDLTP